MSTLRPASAKIVSHFEGLGTPHPDLVRERASEIGLINGRTEATEEDWKQARHELHGGHDLTSNGDSHSLCAWVSERDMVNCDCGHQTDRLPMEDDGNVIEELVAEGMDEAIHEQMLYSRLRERAEDRDEDLGDE